MNKTKSSWKDGIQTFGRSLLLPIALLAPIGMVMGICSAMTQSYMIAKFPFLGNEIVKLIFSSEPMVRIEKSICYSCISYEDLVSFIRNLDQRIISAPLMNGSVFS